MATPLSIYNLINGGWRTVLSIVGISIAIVLIFMQLGFLGAVTDTAVAFYDKMKFDLIVSSPDYYNFVDAGRFSREHIATIESVPGVKKVQPMHISLGKWNYAEKEVQRGILLIGVETGGTTFLDSELNKKTALILPSRTILVDRSSRPKFLGDDNRTPFGDQHIGLSVELNGVACEAVGHFEIGTGLAADGAAIVNEREYAEIVPGYTLDEVGIGLIQLEPDADPEQVKRRILQRFPNLNSPAESPQPIEILTRDEVESRETEYWLTGTPVGFIFFTGAVVAFVVGAIIVYIVLSSDITKQIGEYATLKAMGYKNSYLSKTVLEQAFVLAVTSYALATVVSLVLYEVVGQAANLPIAMNGFRLLFVFSSSLLMSFLSAMIAMQKLRQADPADLF